MLTLSAYHFNIAALPNTVVAAGILLWGGLLRWREADSAAGTWALAVSLAAALWLLGFAGAYCSSEPTVAEHWILLAQVGVVMIPPTLYELLRRLLRLVGWRNSLSIAFWAAASGFLYVLLATHYYLGAPYAYWWGYYARYRIGGTLLAAYLSAVLVFLFLQCLRAWRSAPRYSTRRHRAKVLLVGFGVAFTAAIDFLPCWGLGVYPFGYLMVAFMVTTIGYAAWRYQIVSVSSRAAADHVLKTLSDGVLVLDDLGTIALVNDRAIKLLGLDRNAMLGKPAAEVLPDVKDALLPAETGTRESNSLEIEVPRDCGVRRIINVTVDSMRDERGGTHLTVLVLQDVTSYRDACDRIRELVYFDQATGLPNRRHVHDKLAQALARAKESQLIAVCGLRLERIRHVADHAANSSSDPLLDQTTLRMKAFLGGTPPGVVTVARLHGYQFALLFEQATSFGKLTSELNRLRGLLSQSLAVGARRMRPVIRMGVSLFPNDGNTVEALMDRAAAAVDQAAESGGEHVHFYNAEANAAALQSLMLSTRLGGAIETNDLCLHFQPIINARSGDIDCAEALVRWNDREHGLRFPLEFVPAAEQSGLIVSLDRWVLNEACLQASRWRERDSTGLPTVAVNLSGAHLASSHGADIARTIHEALESTGLPGNRLEIEITESRMVGNDRQLIEGLHRLRETGVRIAVDDFGTGYASLSYLQWFPLDKLKVDQSFVAAIGQDAAKTALLESILSIASQLNLEVVAEGVETPHQAAFLLRHGCDYMQGYLFSRPLPADEFTRIVHSGSGSFNPLLSRTHSPRLKGD